MRIKIARSHPQHSHAPLLPSPLLLRRLHRVASLLPRLSTMPSLMHSDRPLAKPPRQHKPLPLLSPSSQPSHSRSNQPLLSRSNQPLLSRSNLLTPSLSSLSSLLMLHSRHTKPSRRLQRSLPPLLSNRRVRQQGIPPSRWGPAARPRVLAPHPAAQCDTTPHPPIKEG